LNFDDASWALNPIIILAGLKRIWALAQIFSLVFYISFIFLFFLFIFSLYENIAIYDLQESELNWQNKVTSSSPFTPLNSIVSSHHYMMGTDALERAVEFVFDREGNCFGRGWLVVVCVCVCVCVYSDGYGRKAVGFVERGCGRSCWCSCGRFEDGGWGISGICSVW
jgi:hypothetical protein